MNARDSFVADCAKRICLGLMARGKAPSAEACLAGYLNATTPDIFEDAERLARAVVELLPVFESAVRETEQLAAPAGVN